MKKTDETEKHDMMPQHAQIRKHDSAEKQMSYDMAVWNGDPEGRTRVLWEEIFSEDTKRFLDYYYEYKVPRAKIYVLLDKDVVISMLHLNPYSIYHHGKREEAYYIVGVATKEEYRHQGCMRRLLQTAMQDAVTQGCPFLFLMPADPAIYSPFGFTYGYRHKEYRPCGDLTQERIREAVQLGRSAEIKTNRMTFYLEAYKTEHASLLEAYAQKTLRERYQIFCIHDKAYFAGLQRELRSENGELLILFGHRPHHETEIVGYFCYANEDQAFYQEVVAEKEAMCLFEAVGEKDAIMFYGCRNTFSADGTYFPEIV